MISGMISVVTTYLFHTTKAAAKAAFVHSGCRYSNTSHTMPNDP